MLTNLAAMTLGCVFVLSGVAKILQGRRKVREGIAPAMADFPDRVRNVVALCLAPSELLLGLALVLGVRRTIAAACVAVLLACFTFVLARAVRQGRSIQCRCFGSLSVEPVSGWSVTRNVALLALAAVALTSGKSAGADATSGLVTAMLLASSVVAAGLARYGASLHRSLRHWEVNP